METANSLHWKLSNWSLRGYDKKERCYIWEDEIDQEELESHKELNDTYQDMITRA